MRTAFFLSVAATLGAIALVAAVWPPVLWALLLVGPLVLLGFYDVLQREHAVLRNFPVVGHGRYLLELIRPEINQYFIESNTDGRPFSREDRSVVYQRAKHALDTLPFGTQQDVYALGYEWINHSIRAHAPRGDAPRVTIGAEACERPYSASLLNVSAMSFGALSSNAVRALNLGAKLGGFAHNTGEGGLSPYHLENGGDIVWQVGTGYFGCRDAEGRFDAERFVENATREAVRMIEIKLSQGAKPGHGGILPAAKVTPEIAAIRGVPVGKDVISPPAHTAFETPIELLEFVTELRDLSGGKPVGIKLCVGRHSEFLGLCKAMQETRLAPDYIAVDGGEGGTGAAPLEFSNSVGTPMEDGLVFVHNALTGFDLRDRVRVFVSGKVTTGFHLARALALGADLCYAARAMMLAIGCIQARRCNTNHCPVGVATQHPGLVKGLEVASKAVRVHQFHRETIESFLELLGATGLAEPHELRPHHLMRRVAPGVVKAFDELHPFVERGSLLREPVPPTFERAWRAASSRRF